MSCQTRKAALSAAIDGLPKVGEDKFDKLVGVLKKRFEPHGEIREGCFWMPKGDDGITMGYAFIEYSKREVSFLSSSHMHSTYCIAVPWRTLQPR
jgi:translation initiation factor 3 subunit B